MGRAECRIAKVGNEYIAPPVAVDLSNGQTEVIWETVDLSNFELWFPGKSPLAEGNKLVSEGGRCTGHVLPEAEKRKYEYGIHCHGNGHLARGNSSPPIMIIQ